MGAVGRAKASDKKSMRLATTAAASIYRGSVHRQVQSVFLSVSPSRVDNWNFVRCPLAQMGGRCLIRKTSQFQRGSLFLSAWRLSDVLLISYTGSYNVLSAGLLFHSRPRSYFSWSY